MWYHRSSTSTQPVKVNFNLDGNVPAVVIAEVFFLYFLLLSISSVGLRHFDLIQIKKQPQS